jgi:hypothetical protein
MKKTVVIFLLTSFVLSSCGFYTCPTYAKTTAKKAVKESKI